MKVIYNSHEIGDNHNNYNLLTDKPLINSTELVGNITLNDINVYSKEEVKRLISSTRSVKVALVLPSPLTPNTTYYIGPDMNGIYTVYLTDSSEPINAFVIGTTSFGKYYSGDGINVTDPQNVVSVLVDSESVIINSEGLMEARPVFEKMLPFQGATATTDGTKGIVPKPSAGDQNKFLFGDGTWKKVSDLIDTLYPVHSVYFAYSTSVDPSSLFPGTTWQKITSDRAFKTHSGDAQYSSPGVPNIKGSMSIRPVQYSVTSSTGALSISGGSNELDQGFTNGGSFSDAAQVRGTVGFDASKSNSIYTDDAGIRPPAVRVIAYRRTA